MKKLNVAVYIRVANKETSREDSAIENQKYIVNQYLKENIKGIKSKKYYIDNGFSGTTYNRPDFKKMIKDIEEKKINTVIVKDLIRFGRTNNTLDRIEALKRKYNINFISVEENIDSINKKEEFEQIRAIQQCIRDSYRESIRAGRRFAKERMERWFNW